MSDVPAHPAVEDLVSSAARAGWDFFDHPAEKKPADRELQNKQERIAAIASVLFDNVPEFRELMEFLADQTHRRACWVAHLGLRMDEAYGYGVFREGQNALFSVICKLIAEGRKQRPPAPREH